MLEIKNMTRRILFILLFFLTFSPHLPVQSFDHDSPMLFTKDCSLNSKQYFVKAVMDGDTILIEKKLEGINKKHERIRLLGIDAFEFDQAPYGLQAKNFLSMLVLNKAICIETDIQKKDVYDRTLGYVFITRLAHSTNHTPIFVNELLLKSGLAILYDFPPNVKYIERLKKAQTYARRNMLGAWEKQDYILETPSQFRKKHPFKKKNH